MDRAERLDDPEESLRMALEGTLARLWTAGPGIVHDVDLEKQTCSVQLAIQGETTGADGTVQRVALPMLVDVPLVFPRAGGFAVTFPVKSGDEVLVVFGARCIDAWYQSGGVQPAAEARMHDLSDGFAIPGPTSQPRKLTNVSATDLQMRNEAGDAYVGLTPAGGLVLKGASLTVDIDGAAQINATSLTHNAKNIGDNHAHGGIEPGGGTTSGPV